MAPHLSNEEVRIPLLRCSQIGKSILARLYNI